MMCPTPHIAAKKGDFGNTVLMPGDPLRARYIAETYLEDAVLVNNIRGVQGYTGEYKGARVSVMASGMGMPSIALYSYELYKYYGVETILRVGTAGAIREDVHTRSIVLGMGCCTDSSYEDMFELRGRMAPIADFDTLRIAAALAKERGLCCHVGNLLSTDRYYTDGEERARQINKRWAEMGVLAVEMEGAALYMNAARFARRALTVCTVSNHILTGEELPVMERQEGLNEMITLALDTAVELEKLPRL
ncbi:MAG: purine-nucleoside phosphorylase [Clostridia bacterium]|nr:purine-nucleoside phosphorylase [Clostridia bacterium]